MASRLPDFQSPGDADLQNILGSFYSKLDLSPPVPPLLTNKTDKQAKKGGPGGGGSKTKSGANAGSAKKSAADAAAQAKIDKEFEPPETPLETVADPEPAKKEKVVLSNPQWGEAKPGFNAETPISVDVLLPAEHAIKTKISFDLFAKTPKGNELICSGEAHAKDGKATCSIPVYIPAYKDESGNRMQKVGYYFIAKHSEAEPLDSSPTPKVVDEMAERVIESHILQNVTFVTGKSFIRTSEAADLKALGQAVKDWKGKHPEGKLAVFGHADAVGEELSNKQLSERRAKSVHAYLAKDPKPWEELYGAEKWGLICVQELLKHLGHDPGTLDGQDGPKTQAAVKDFQGKKGLPATGNADTATREALFKAYFESAGSPGSGSKDFDVIDGKAFTGCSEFNLIENTQGACEANRRVAVLLLKVSKNFPLTYPCKQGAILPCQNQTKLQGQRRTVGFRCKFYDGLVVEKKGPVPKPVGKLKWIGLKDKEEIKQYVNLKADKPNQGPERTLEVEIEGVADGSPVFWKVTAGKDNSKRNDPKPGVKSEAKGALVEFKSGVAELETQVKGGKASLVLACGLAGGDLYLVEVGTAKGKADAWVSVENWRKLWYQLTHHKAITPPSMATAIKQLKDVFIEWINEPSVTHDLAPKGNVIVGRHNSADYHKLLSTNHPGQCAHIILCDFQFDGVKPGGGNYTTKSSENFTSAKDTITVSDDSNTLKVLNPPLPKGAKLLIAATWSNASTGKFGKLTDDATKCDENTGLAKWKDPDTFEVELPKNATPSAKTPVSVSMHTTAASGPWGGDGGTAPHNLVVIDSSDVIHSQVVLHELGHIINMVPIAGSYKAPPGMKLSEHVLSYTGMGGSGSHCSWEIDKTKSSTTRNVDGKCIMFHQLNSNCKLVYCPDCAPFVKAQSLLEFHDLKG